MAAADGRHAAPSPASDAAPAVSQSQAQAQPVPAPPALSIPGTESSASGIARSLEQPAGVGFPAFGIGAVGPSGQVLMPGHSPPATRSARWAAGQIASQIAGRISAPVAGGLTALSSELALTPPELGRITIRFETDSGSGVLVLQVERPETLDLMRRHQELLQDALRDAGQAGCSVMLGGRDPAQGGMRRDPGPDRPDNARAPGDSDDQTALSPIRSATRLAGAGRLDLRF